MSLRQSKIMVPENMEDLDSAKQIMKVRFSSLDTVVLLKLNALTRMGRDPEHVTDKTMCKDHKN